MQNLVRYGKNLYWASPDYEITIGNRQRSSFAQNIETIPYRPTRKYARVESSASAVDGNERAMVDAGLALGRSFRVGWGPSGTLVHLGELCGPFTPL
jgi:nuclear pore complex protein Nup98-Nup96